MPAFSCGCHGDGASFGRPSIIPQPFPPHIRAAEFSALLDFLMQESAIDLSSRENKHGCVFCRGPERDLGAQEKLMTQHVWFGRFKGTRGKTGYCLTLSTSHLEHFPWKGMTPIRTIPLITEHARCKETVQLYYWLNAVWSLCHMCGNQILAGLFVIHKRAYDILFNIIMLMKGLLPYKPEIDT